METRRSSIDITCSGNPREFGIQIGECLRTRIASAIESLTDYDGFRASCPWYVPFSYYQRFAERWALWNLLGPTEQTCPRIAERLVGMAEGAGCRLGTFYLFHSLESLSISSSRSTTLPIAGCTAIGTQTADMGSPCFLAHNLDGVAALGESLVIRESRGLGQNHFLSLSFAALGGTIDGINDCGLSITYNWAFATDSIHPAPSTSMLIDEALGTCRNAAHAIEFITGKPRCGGAMLMLADSDGTVAALELSNQNWAVRYPRNKRPIFHSNQYRTSKMQPHQISRDAIYSKQSPAVLHGTRVLQSAEHRDARLRQLIRMERRLNRETVCQLLQDHGHSTEGSDDTICMHGQLWTTQASIQLIPLERSMSVSFGAACVAAPISFHL